MQAEITAPALHVGQMEVDRHPARFKVLACGRRWGKTRYGSWKGIETALKGGVAWWVAPSFPIGSIGWRGIKDIARQIDFAEIRQGDRMVRFPGGGFVQVRSADDPDSLRGIGLDYLVIDEAAYIKEDAWKAALRPALTDRLGKALIISTPHGKNWFFDAFQRGLDPLEEDWQSWRYTSYDNPFLQASEIDSSRSTMPARLFEQEFLAEFIEGAGDVFRGVMEAATAPLDPEYNPHHTYVMGTDWGRHTDFTVNIVIDATTSEMVAIDRYNRVDWPLQRSRLTALAREWRVSGILAESNAIGEPNISELERDGLPVTPFETTAKSKPELIESLVVALENGELAIQNDPVLIGELMSYGYEALPSGRYRYQAPQGKHDDCVMALALAWKAQEYGYSDAGAIAYAARHTFSNSPY